MDIVPILRALLRNKVGAALIGLQIALTLAILCNSLSVVQQLSQRMRLPSGVDEANTFMMSTFFLDDPPDIKARLLGDLAALRSIPGVIDADTIISFPLSGVGYNAGLSLKPDQKFPTTSANLYFSSDHGLKTWDLKLIAGRWFHPDEVGELHYYENHYPPTVVVTRALADALYPLQGALGKELWFPPAQGSRIIGIVETVLTPGDVTGGVFGRSVFIPELPINKGSTYVVRTRPGAQAAVIRAAQERLYQLANRRMIQNVFTVADLRRMHFQLDRTVSIVLSVVCTLMLVVTACGVVGLTTYWVTQRRRQIGMRRALGARRIDILAYFHSENFIIAGAGSVLGIAMGLAGNIWLVRNLALVRVSPLYVCVGALVVLGLCQMAVFWPARRAASVAPAIATRAL